MPRRLERAAPGTERRPADTSLNASGVFAAPVWVHDVTVGAGRAIAAGDADGDGDLDLYGMVDGPHSNPDDVVLINADLSFTALAVPSAGGTADNVDALHLRRNRVDFLVMNGRKRHQFGALQLIRVMHQT